MVNVPCVTGRTQYSSLLHDVHVSHVVVNNVWLVRCATSRYIAIMYEEVSEEPSITVVYTYSRGFGRKRKHVNCFNYN